MRPQYPQGPPPQGYNPAGYPQQPGYTGANPQQQWGYQGPGGYPQQGYPPGYGPPPSGGYPPPGYPMPVPPPRPYDEESAQTVEALEFFNTTVRMQFIRKVYSILSVQIAVTSAIIALFTFHKPTRMFVLQHPGLFLIALVIMIVTLITLSCCGNVRRSFPMNFICLSVFTLAEGFLLGVSTARYNADMILYAALITMVATISLTIFAFQTSIDFTVCGGVLFVAVIILLVFGIVCMFFPSQTMRLIFASVGALLFSIFIVYDTQLMLGGKHKESISPEEYIFAALSLYIDIVNLFMMILQILGIMGED